MDPKILPVSYKDKLVGRDEKKVSDEKKDEKEPSFDGLKDVDSFASSEATLTEEYLEMYAQNSGVYAHARKFGINSCVTVLPISGNSSAYCTLWFCGEPSCTSW